MACLAREFFCVAVEEKLRYDMSGGKKDDPLSYAYFPLKWTNTQEKWSKTGGICDVPFVLQSKLATTRGGRRSRLGGVRVVEENSTRPMDLACKLLGVLSEAMDLDREALRGPASTWTRNWLINFYPKCPQPDPTLGPRRHTDPGTITIPSRTRSAAQATKDGGQT
ncbi:hypothetical protein HPP92_025703 [Vanilla planifolia]|uniref:Uncharacterized protein n=1 Tax=Vanilla planifolia TaxID=51239 RepID=A0A835U804_VANPL|nr:hypothetical protein HPP92_025703 [Vanilla planifolia]